MAARHVPRRGGAVLLVFSLAVAMITGLAPPAFALSGISMRADSDAQMFWMEGVEAAVPIDLSPASSGSVYVDYHTEPLTATEGVDYQYTSGTKYFSPGMIGSWIFVNIYSDTIPEGDETFAIVLSNPVNAEIVDGYGVVTIEDDDEDIIPPNTYIDGGPSGTTTSTSATFTFSATETATFECRLDAAGWTGCSSPISYYGLGLGAHTFYVRATDVWNNTDPTPASRSWTIQSSDTSPPDTTIDSGPSGSTTSTSATFTFSATETATFECRLDAAGWTGCSSPISYYGLGLGGHTFYARATDLANNTDLTPASRSWTVTAVGPSNDAFANAYWLSGTYGSRCCDTNVGATAEPGEPAHGWHTAEHSVWYAWTAPVDGRVTVDTIGSDFDTMLAVYTGSNVGGLTSVVYDDDIDYPANVQSLLAFQASAGITYRFAVDGVIYNADQGTVAITLAETLAPGNDDFANAMGLGTGDADRWGDSNVAATIEPGEPAQGYHSPLHTVWYTWTAPADGVATIDTIGSDFDTMLGVYTGSNVGSLTEVAYDDDIDYPEDLASKVVVDVTQGTVYRIVVDGYRPDDEGTLQLHVRFVARPANDRFASAITLSGTQADRCCDTTVNATSEPGEPAHDWHSAEHSVWYLWTAPKAGTVTIDTVGSQIDTVLAAYRGTNVGALTKVASNDDLTPGSYGPSRVTFKVTAGTQYRIAIDGCQWDADQGSVQLHLRFAAFVYKPDAQIRRSTSSVWVGGGVYNPTGAGQTVTSTARRGAKATFVVQVHNDGNTTDPYRLVGVGSAGPFKVTYFAGQSGTTNITTAVVGGRYQVRLAPGAKAYVRVVVKVTTTAAFGASKTLPVTATSIVQPATVDRVKGVVTVVR